MHIGESMRLQLRIRREPSLVDIRGTALGLPCLLSMIADLHFCSFGYLETDFETFVA